MHDNRNMPAPATVRGWCPGALRPMETGDGYLVRLRLSGGILAPMLAAQLADLSRRFGNSRLDLSSRANLQLRGVQERHLEELRRELDRLGLLDADEAAEAVKNVSASPLAGLDPTAHLDIRPLVSALEERLVADKALHALPGKFHFAIDDGGRFPLGSALADIAAVATAPDRMTVFLGGVLAGTAPPEQLSEVAARGAHAFLDLRADERRLAPLIARVGVEEFRIRTGIATAPGETDDRALPPAAGYFQAGVFGVLGLAAPFGSLSAVQLSFIADLAQSHGAEIRLSPWRALFVAGRGISSGLAIVAQTRGFITNPNDPRLAVAACPGSPACRSAHSAARQDAERLAPLAAALGSGISLHVSGCQKGCARAQATAATLVGSPDGYRLVLGGKADGKSVADGLDLTGAEALLRRLAASLQSTTSMDS